MKKLKYVLIGGLFLLNLQQALACRENIENFPWNWEGNGDHPHRPIKTFL